MARFIIEQRVTDPKGLQDFDLGGYRFDRNASTDHRLVFRRDEAKGQELKAAS